MSSLQPAPLILALLLGLGVVACSGEEEQGGDDDDSAQGDDDDSGEDPELTAVRVSPAELGKISETIKSSSTVLAEKRVDILLEVGGTVRTLRVEEGDDVRAGQILAVLKNPQTTAELKRSEANFAKASEDFSSIQGLYDQGYVARREFDEAQLALDTARATVAQAREADASRKIKSPIRGTVSLRGIRYGEAVSPGKLAFQVVDLRDLLVEVSLPEKDLGRLRVGQEVRVQSELLAGKAALGQVERISPVIDARTGTVKVTVAIAPKERRVLPGMFVQLEIVVATHQDALLVPKVALVYDEGKTTVFRVEEDVAVRRVVAKGFSGAEQVEVLEGLAPGDRIVVAGQSLLQDGAKVRVIE